MTPDVLRTAAIPTSSPPCARSPAQSGTTLIACVLVMFGVAMLISAALRSLEDGISLTHNAVDRRLAQRAADAALHDAALMLMKVPDQISVAEAEGAHRIGELTGETYAYGGHLQPIAPPDYVLEVIASSDADDRVRSVSTPFDIYRVTAQGKGRRDSTAVILQADFALQRCKTGSDAVQNTEKKSRQGTEGNISEEAGQTGGQNAEPAALKSTNQTTTQSTTQNAEQGRGHSSGKGMEQTRAACVPGVRRLAWRVLQAN